MTGAGIGDVQQRRRPAPGAAQRRSRGRHGGVADPALPHQAGHEGKLPGEGREQPHGLHQVRADGLQSIHCSVLCGLGSIGIY